MPDKPLEEAQIDRLYLTKAAHEVALLYVTIKQINEEALTMPGSRLGNFTELPTRKLNRLAARSPKTGVTWCGCDAAKTGVGGGKCSACGHKIKWKMKSTEVS